MGSDAGAMPPELVAPTLVLVGLSGLDIRNNAIHRAIWDALSSNRRADRAPIQFKLLPNNYEFPICKPKRSSYEWYLPRGILKRNWLSKHLSALPSLVVVFYELEWNDSQWAERRLECASRIQSMRAALQGRNTRLGLALIQKGSLLQPPEDIQASERAAALCSSCDITTKMLFVLPHSDHLMGYALRLESAFLELSHGYYQQMSRVVRSHKDQLTAAHQGLKTRHQFKMGLLAELRQDYNVALKHYTQAYSTLDEIRVVDTNCLEIKTVAGYINYKSCRLMFQLNLPRDAIHQFKTHLERYRNRAGFREIIFEHHSWLSSQYNAFAELFCEAVRNGLPAIQTQHPGFYFHLAAKRSMQRKLAIQQIIAANFISEDTVVANISLSEYYGQRTVSGPMEPMTEAQITTAIQKQESTVDHASIIISLLGSAISQFKAYRCPRMRRRILVEMGEQYLLSGDTGKALTLFTHMLSDYRSEGLMDLWRLVHTRAVYASCISASIQDYLSLCTEALAIKLSDNINEQTRVAANIDRVLEGLPPEPEPALKLENSLSPLPTMSPQTMELWRSTLMSPQKISIHMESLACCIISRAGFKTREIPIDWPIEVQIFLRSASKIPLKFSKLLAVLTCSERNTEIPVLEDSLFINPGETKMFWCKTTPGIFQEGTEIQINSIVLYMGSKNIQLVLHIPAVEAPSSNLIFEFNATKTNWNFISTDPICSAVIVTRLSNLICDTAHNAPALRGEWHEISLNLHNKENCDIQNIMISISVQEQAAEFTLNPLLEQAHENNFQFTLNDISCDSKVTTKLYVRSQLVSNLTICVKVNYNLKQPLHSLMNSLTIDSVNTLLNHCATEHIIVISVVEPFEVTTEFLSADFKQIQHCYAGDRFLLMTQLNVKGPWPVIIEDTALKVAGPISVQATGPSSQLKGLNLHKGERCSEVVALESVIQMEDGFQDDKPPLETLVPAGIYNVLWRRHDVQRINTTSITMPHITIKSCLVHMTADLPAEGLVRNILPLQYFIRSCCDYLLHLRATLDSSEAFMFSGHKEMLITLLPHSKRALAFNLFPLLCGYVALPKLIIMLDNSEQIYNHGLPSHIYIMPQMKSIRTVLDSALPVEVNQ